MPKRLPGLTASNHPRTSWRAPSVSSQRTMNYWVRFSSQPRCSVAHAIRQHTHAGLYEEGQGFCGTKSKTVCCWASVFGCIINCAGLPLMNCYMMRMRRKCAEKYGIPQDSCPVEFFKAERGSHSFCVRVRARMCACVFSKLPGPYRRLTPRCR